jgi:hypothetical protein
MKNPSGGLSPGREPWSWTLRKRRSEVYQSVGDVLGCRTHPGTMRLLQDAASALTPLGAEAVRFWQLEESPRKAPSGMAIPDGASSLERRHGASPRW